MKKTSPAKRKRQEYFDLASILTGVGSPAYVRIGNDGLKDLQQDDLLLVDRARTKPRNGDYVVWETSKGFTVGYFDSDYEYDDPVYGIAVTVIRHFKKAKRQKSKRSDPALASLQRQLERLESVPENEAERFKLETEIYQLKHRTQDWPDVIGEGGSAR